MTSKPAAASPEIPAHVAETPPAPTAPTAPTAQVAPAPTPAGTPTKDNVHPDPTRYGDWERKGRCIDF